MTRSSIGRPRLSWARRALVLRSRLLRLGTFVQVLIFAGLVSSGLAHAAPEAHILRIDPRASQVDGSPVLTMVVEIVQNKRMSDITGPCAAFTGNANIDCVADAMTKTQALYSPFDFPEENAIFTVKVDGSEIPAQFVSKARWGDSTGEAGVGTAWLILIDAASSMGKSFDEAKQVAAAFVNALGPNDIVDIMFFNDRAVVSDSKWVADKNAATSHLNSVAGTFPSQEGRARGLMTIIKRAATDGFKELGNAGQSIQVPMHQAMVVLSNGAAGADPSTTGAGAQILAQFMSKGRFPEDNDALPKTPVPVISVWFPLQQVDELRNSQREFMEGMANTDIGGFYTIVRDGQGARANKIVQAVRQRFDKMHIVKWRVSCVSPTLQQSFNLFFQNTNPTIAPDATFSNVPVGIDPTTWPLDVDFKATEDAAKKNPIYPGGTVKVYGNFCWGGNAQQAELYMVPKNQSAPQTLQGGSIEDAKKAQRTLIEAGMRGKAVSAGDTVVEFEVPDTTKFLVGKGEKMTARMIIYDNASRRTSAVTADKIISLQAQEKPLNYILIGGITFGGVIVILLLVTVFRSGGSKRRGPAQPPPKPIVAAGPAPIAPMAMGQPAPMMMGGQPPMGGGMGPNLAGGAVAGGALGGGFAGGGVMPAGGASQATLSGSQGIFTILPGMEMRAGRDGSVCQILLTEPRVSGTHSSLKIEGGQLLVRDESSNNGTHINGQRIPPGVWTPVGPGAQLRFGPVEFSVRLE
jgi:hypothetical protein